MNFFKRISKARNQLQSEEEKLLDSSSSENVKMPKRKSNANRSSVNEDFVQTKQDWLAYKKNVEGFLSTDGKSVYTDDQLGNAVNRSKSQKKALNDHGAKKNGYVKFRKEEILETKVSTLQTGNDAFPKCRQPQTGFDRLKARFFKIRSNAENSTLANLPKIKLTQDELPTDYETLEETFSGDETLALLPFNKTEVDSYDPTDVPKEDDVLFNQPADVFAKLRTTKIIMQSYL